MSEVRFEIPEGVQFGTVYADPPWALDKPNTKYRRRRTHYDRMSGDEIKSIPVNDFTSPDAHLWLWTTTTHLELALEVVKAWGFQYKTLASWRKTKVGTGWWLRSRFEHLILAAKTTELRHNPGSYTTEITGEYGGHSKKPETVLPMIEALSPGPYLEMFARNGYTREGWIHAGVDGVPQDAFGQEHRHERGHKNAMQLDVTDGVVRGVGGLEIHPEQNYTLLTKKIIPVPVTAISQNKRRVKISLPDGSTKSVSIDSLRAEGYEVA